MIFAAIEFCVAIFVYSFCFNCCCLLLIHMCNFFCGMLVILVVVVCAIFGFLGQLFLCCCFVIFEVV